MILQRFYVILGLVSKIMIKFFQTNKTPLAIIIAGILIAGSIYFSNSPSDNFSSNDKIESYNSQNQETKNPAVKSVTDKIEENNFTESVSQSKSTQGSLYKVVKVIDGDTVTVEIDGKKETIRLIGVDTPETVDPRKPVECFGIEASNKAKEILMGKSVRLEADSIVGERGKYGRLLRYIFSEDGTNFNKMMINEGYAHEYTYNSPYKYQNEFKQAEKEARESKRGLWGDGVCESNDALPTATNDSLTVPTTTATSIPAASTTTTNTTGNAECYCASNKYNCGDFQTHQEAQNLYDCCLQKVGTDIHRLDKDKDGSACESLP